MSVLETLKASPLFYDLYDEEIDLILQRGDVISYEPGDFVVKDGDQGSELFILLTGKAEARKKGGVLAELKRGDIIGELVLLNESTRTADIVATSHTDILSLDYEDIYDLYKKSPKVFSLIILNLARLLTRRLKNTGELINRLNQKIDDLEKKAA